MYYIYPKTKIYDLRPFLEQVETGSNSSIKVNTYVQSLIDVPLHYHPENEIVCIQKGEGRLFIADIEEDFGQGDLFYICGEVPHLFQEKDLSLLKRKPSQVGVIQYRKNLFEGFHELPEFQHITRFEKNISYGIKLSSTKRMASLFKSLEKNSGIFRFNLLTELLNEIISHGKYSLLGNISGKSPSNHISYIRLQKINSFLTEYSSRDITIEMVADILHLNKTSLCRFLKRETDKTFSEHVNFYRIAHACKLLRDSEDSVVEICYAAGFNNPAYFFRQFKKLKKSTPMEYREKHTVI